MANNWFKTTCRHLVFLVLVAIRAVPALGQQMDAQPANLIAAGYATPGSPQDVAFQTQAGKPFGGTVFYAVYQRTGRPGDTWSLRPGFDSMFVEGANVRHGTSPHLDTGARYLYLYQVINDRAIQDPKVNKPNADGLPAAVDPLFADTKLTGDIASFSLRLVVDPTKITSWGYFRDSGFSMFVPSEEDRTQIFSMAVSSHPSMEDVFPTKDYCSEAPALEIAAGRSGFGVSSITLNLNRNPDILKREVGGIRLADYQETAKSGGLSPDMVQIFVADATSFKSGVRVGPSDDKPLRGIFRVDWRNKSVAEGEQSVVFGFTSDLPPIRQPIKIGGRTDNSRADIGGASAEAFPSPKPEG